MRSTSSQRVNSPVRCTLMCKNVEVATFTYDPRKRLVTGKTHLLNPEFLPVGCRGHDGGFSTASLGAWISARGIPPTRPGLSPVLASLNLATSEELQVSGLGLSLSDHYWFRPLDAPDVDWTAVNFFENPFSSHLGEALAPHDPDSGSLALHRIEEDGLLATSSPDAALNGNLPKRWEIAPDGTRLLVKSGKAANMHQEPFNETVATALCRRLFDDGGYVPYRLQPNGYPAYVSTCPCMVDTSHELVIAGDVMRSCKPDPAASRFENYAAACASHGIDNIRVQLARMLVVDYVMANFDRHWGNFGVIVETDTRCWVGAAPIYDTGESLWCDRALTNDFGPYTRSLYPMPFSTDIDSQLARYIQPEDLAWFDPGRLDGFIDEAVTILAQNREIAAMPGRLDGIATALARRIAKVAELARG